MVAVRIVFGAYRSAATGQQPPRAPVTDGPVTRIAFFGRIDDKKGIRPFVAAINELDTQLLERIERYVSEDVRPSANGIAIFACSAADFFEALQLDAPIERHRLTVGDRPHLYPLARVVDRYPRHAVVLANTNHARIYVFGRGRTIDREELASEKVSRTDVGGRLSWRDCQ